MNHSTYFKEIIDHVSTSLEDTTVKNAVSDIAACVNTTSDYLKVNVQNFPATQTVAGSVSVSNFPGTQAVLNSGLTKLDTNLLAANDLIGVSTKYSLIAGIDADDLVKAVAVDENGLLEVSADCTGTISVSNFPATQPISGSISVSNFPATQPISGSVSISGTPAVTVSSGSINATCSGTVAVSSLSGTSAVSLADMPHMYIANGTNTLNASTNKGNLGLTVEYGVGKFNPLVCNSTQRLLVADTTNETLLTDIKTLLTDIKNILTDVHNDAGNSLRTTVV